MWMDKLVFGWSFPQKLVFLYSSEQVYTEVAYAYKVALTLYFVVALEDPATRQVMAVSGGVYLIGLTFTEAEMLNGRLTIGTGIFGATAHCSAYTLILASLNHPG